jgi:hypothetical protein
MPDLPALAYQELLERLNQEFAHTFGGCTIIRGIDGSYLSRKGLLVSDRINLIYTDVPLSIQDNLGKLSRYGDALRLAVDEALEEETVLVVIYAVYQVQ